MKALQGAPKGITKGNPQIIPEGFMKALQGTPAGDHKRT